MFENLKAFIRHGRNAEALNSLSSLNIHDTPRQSGPAETEIINDRYQYATQIVEQEKSARRNQMKYPNLDNYQVMEQLGEGAFSIVYKAKNILTGELVAVKILRKFQMDQMQKQSVLKEVTIMRQLNHPNITRFIEFIDSDPYYYIVEELVAGGEVFAAIVKYTYLLEDLSRHIISQVAHAIRYLHEEVGIVHRDIKPENLLYYPIEFIASRNGPRLRKSDDPNKIDEGEFIAGIGGGTVGIVKLADFGLLKQIWDYNTKTPCGTVGYTAPEIVKDEKYLKEVDMWAIGCVLYTLLCGFPPFYDERIDVLTEKVAKGEYMFLSPWWDEISSEAKYCVSRLLTVDPGKRYTIDEFLKDPWITKGHNGFVNAAEQPQGLIRHSIKNFDKYKRTYGKEMYSPAAVALRDAFDISTAVHRMGEEAKLTRVSEFQDLLEEEEFEEDVNMNGAVVRSKSHEANHHEVPQKVQGNIFDLNLKGASILERRKNKPVMIPS